VAVLLIGIGWAERHQPGLGVVLAARVPAEFGDDPHRYASAKARKAYAGTAPVTRASGLRQGYGCAVATIGA
jgi:transposase